jgi:hypothetical protein
MQEHRELALNADEVQAGHVAGLELHQHVDVALRPEIVAKDRAERRAGRAKSSGRATTDSISAPRAGRAMRSSWASARGERISSVPLSHVDRVKQASAFVGLNISSKTSDDAGRLGTLRDKGGSNPATLPTVMQTPVLIGATSRVRSPERRARRPFCGPWRWGRRVPGAGSDRVTARAAVLGGRG